MYSVKLCFIVIVVAVLLPTVVLKVNCQCTETRRAVRNYGQILPAGVAPSVEEGHEGDHSSTLKPEASKSKEEHEEEEEKDENRSTIATFKKDLLQKRTDNKEEEDIFRREKDRWNNSEKDKEDVGNIIAYTSSSTIAPNSQYLKKALLSAWGTEKPTQNRGNHSRPSNSSSSDQYKKKANDTTAVYNGYIVAPKVNISRKAAEIDREKHHHQQQQHRVSNGHQISSSSSNLERNKKESANYDRPVLTGRNVNQPAQKEVAANGEIDFRKRENVHLRNVLKTNNSSRPNGQKQEKVQKNKHKEEEENEEEEDKNE